MSRLASAATPAPCSSAHVFHKAWEDFRQIVRPEHQRLFDQTSTEDVRDTAQEIEQRLAEKQLSRDLPRLLPLLESLSRLAKVIPTVHDDPPYARWLWAPIKLYIVIASEAVEALEKVLDTYEDILGLLPECQVLESESAGLVYADVLLIHKHLYTVLICRGWKVFFSSSWLLVTIHLNAIETSLGLHRNSHAARGPAAVRQNAESSVAPARAPLDMRDHTLNFTNINASGNAYQHNGSIYGNVDNSTHTYYGQGSSASVELPLAEERRRIYERAVIQTAERVDKLFQSTLGWLGIRDYSQEDEFDQLRDKQHRGTCEWIYKDSDLASWIAPGPAGRKMWLHGKPGIGKSVHAASLIEHVRSEHQVPVAYHLCSFMAPDRNQCSHFLRSLAAQLLRQDKHRAAYVYTQYVQKGQQPSMKEVKQCVVSLLCGIQRSRIIIDGLDECAVEEQLKLILTSAFEIVDKVKARVDCKILIASRDVSPIDTLCIRNKCVVFCLDHKLEAIKPGIRSYVQAELSRFLEAQVNLHANQVEIEIRSIEDELVTKAEGVFLWVRLVLSGLDRILNVHQLRNIVRDLPPGLEAAYARALEDMRRRQTQHEFAQAIAVFYWITFGNKPTTGEVADAIAYTTPPYLLNSSTKLPIAVLRTAKPLIEFGAGDDAPIAYVHFSVRQYFLKAFDGDRLPVIQQLPATKNILLACSRALHDSLDLVDPSLIPEQRLSRVVHGLHMLHTYAEFNWVLHLRQYLDIQAQGTTTDPQVETVLGQLGSRYESIMARRDPGVVVTSTPAAADFQRLCDHPGFLGVVTLLLGRDLLKIPGTHRTKPPSVATSPVPAPNLTLFQEARRFVSWAEESLSHPEALANFPHLDEGDLENFRARFARTRFMCRIDSCSNDSFRSEKARDEHERSHQATLYCLAPDCYTAPLDGFATRQMLTKHNNKYHRQQRSAQLPQYRPPLENMQNGAPGQGPPPNNGQQQQNSGMAVPDMNSAPFGALDGADQFPMDLANLESGDVLANFDFDSFLNGDDDGLAFDAFGDGSIETDGLN